MVDSHPRALYPRLAFSGYPPVFLPFGSHMPDMHAMSPALTFSLSRALSRHTPSCFEVRSQINSLSLKGSPILGRGAGRSYRMAVLEVFAGSNIQRTMVVGRWRTHKTWNTGRVLYALDFSFDSKRYITMVRRPMLKASTFSTSTSMRFTLRIPFIQVNPGIAITTDRIDVPGRSRSRILLW